MAVEETTCLEYLELTGLVEKEEWCEKKEKEEKEKKEKEEKEGNEEKKRRI